MTARATRPTKMPAAKTVHAVLSYRNERAAGLDKPSMEEPSLNDMLQDPIMQRLMSSDGITRSQLLMLVAAARSRLLDRRWAE